jgi:hypothetical protein
MTGVETYLEDVRPYLTSYVTFVDGAKGKIVGIGNLIKHGLPRLDDVLLVKGLTANLFSISQLCDLGLRVNFTKPECQISDEKGEVLLRHKVQRQLLSLGILGGIIHLNMFVKQRGRDQAMTSKVGTFASERDEEGLIIKSY